MKNSKKLRRREKKGFHHIKGTKYPYLICETLCVPNKRNSMKLEKEKSGNPLILKNGKAVFCILSKSSTYLVCGYSIIQPLL